jgi:catechol 2,3-dioxygenase-like lactoylglutathione lyase family enzyme
MNLAFAELGVRNLAISLAWYRSVLGLTLELHDEPRGFALLKDDSGSKMALKQGPPGAIRWQFEVPNLDAAIADLASKGIALESGIQASAEGYRRAVLRDPDGNAVALFDWHPCG